MAPLVVVDFRTTSLYKWSMDQPMAGKAPLQVVGWLGRTGYQTVINEAARQASQASKIEANPQHNEPPAVSDPRRG
jgi:hypothetical protein